MFIHFCSFRQSRSIWFVYNDYFIPLLNQKKVNTVIEVGVFLGNFCCNLAEKLPQGAKLFAVDHWLGVDDFYANGCTYYGRRETEFQQFLSNVIHRGVTDKVIPVRMKSVEASKKLKALGVKADLIYIDAAHDYQSVIDDLNAWYPLLAEGGTFCGDAWTWQGVRDAVIAFAYQKQLAIHAFGSLWVVEANKIKA
jgi:hypothetical protein